MSSPFEQPDEPVMKLLGASRRRQLVMHLARDKQTWESRRRICLVALLGLSPSPCMEYRLNLSHPYQEKFYTCILFSMLWWDFLNQIIMWNRSNFIFRSVVIFTIYYVLTLGAFSSGSYSGRDKREKQSRFIWISPTLASKVNATPLPFLGTSIHKRNKQMHNFLHIIGSNLQILMTSVQGVLFTRWKATLRVKLLRISTDFMNQWP